MSLTFVLPGTGLPDTPVLKRSLPERAVLCTKMAGADVLGRIVVPQTSTRGVLVRWEAERGVILDVRSLASEADLAAAVWVAAALAEEIGVQVEVAGRTSTAERLRARWTPNRVAWHVQQDERSIRSLAQGSRLRIDAVNRPVVIGPVVLAGLADEAGQLLDWLREVQWLEGPDPIALTPAHLAGDRAGPSVVRLEPGIRMLLGSSDLVEIPGDPALYVERGEVASLLEGHSRLLDECQLLVEPLDAADWESLRSAAAPLKIEDPSTWRRGRVSRRRVLPELRPPSWIAADEAVVWPLREGDSDGLPLVSLIEERGRTRTLVSAADLEPAELTVLRARAVAELEARLPEWEVTFDARGRAQAVTLTDAYASEALLSARALQTAHDLLDASVLVAAAPVRGVLRIERAQADAADDPSDPAALLEWAQSTWEAATRTRDLGTPLTPHLILIVDGRIRGRANEADPQMPDEDQGSIDMPGFARRESPPVPVEPAATPVFRGDDRAILALAVPALGSLAVEPVVALVDTAFVASLGDAAVGALGVAGAILSLAFVVFNFLAYGTTPLVAEARARGERDEAGRTVVAALTLALAIGTVGGLLVFLLAPLLVGIMGATGEVYDAAVTYLSIRTLGAPGLLLIIAGHGAYRGFQDTATPLLVSGGVALVNLGLDALFLVGLGWGIEGAAWASVAAQWAGALGFVVLLFGPQGHRRAVPRSLPTLRDLVRLLSVGSVLSVRTLAVVGVMAFAASVATRMGETSIAAHQVVHQLWMAAALLADGLAIAAQALIAAAPGPSQRRAVARRLLGWGVFTGIGLAGLLLMSQLVLPVAFRLSEDALLLASQAALVAALVQPVAALVFVGDGMYLGAQRFGFAAWSMVAAAGVGVVALLLFPLGFGLLGVWLALAVFVVARGLLLAGGGLGFRGAARRSGQDPSAADA